MPIIHDNEFGDITVTRRRLSASVSARVAPSGKLRINLPSWTPLCSAKTLINISRPALRKLLAKHHATHTYLTSQPIGKSHQLLIERTGTNVFITHSGTTIIARIPQALPIKSPIVQSSIREHIVRALRKEAKHYLPRRLAYLAEQYGFSYASVRLMHASSRWGSCSSRGTISLNIALMNVPFELLDYVLVHELAHTRQMNHSEQFWAEVARIDPNYRQHRTTLKSYSPHI